MTLREDIETAFSSATKPLPSEITTCPCEECRDIATYFGGTSWEGHSTEELRNHETFLFHGTPKAFGYYLPAFMIAAIDDYDRSQAIPDLIVVNMSLTDCESYNSLVRERIESLSDEQIQVVRRFLQHLVMIGDCSEKETAGARASLTERRT